MIVAAVPKQLSSHYGDDNFCIMLWFYSSVPAVCWMIEICWTYFLSIENLCNRMLTSSAFHYIGLSGTVHYICKWFISPFLNCVLRSIVKQHGWWLNDNLGSIVIGISRCWNFERTFVTVFSCLLMYSARENMLHLTPYDWCRLQQVYHTHYFAICEAHVFFIMNGSVGTQSYAWLTYEHHP